MNTRITELLNIEKPIIQGGLAYLAYADLTAAVSNAGGLGQVTALSLPTPEALREEIRRTRTLTDKPFGVNFAFGMHGMGYEPFAQVAIEENVPVISITGGNPAPMFELLKGTSIKTLVLVAGVRQAQKAEQLGADGVIVVGQEGGGHLGRDDLGTIVLTPRVVDSVSIPVVASGGIADGRGLAAALALGAEGIEMGTRFIATKECVEASDYYKQLIVQGSEMDTVVVKRSIGAPARVLHNDYADEILKVEQKTPTYEALKSYISGEVNRRLVHEGQPDGFAFAGQVIGLIEDVPTVSELMERIMEQYVQITKKWCET
ncbi:nitronate monooxygenase family protein [Paenibacillus sediminis]|uniref:Probable nitronate monooxygenase n=1 Tax=Paenibacillus sediminis TaxID=664909 RepID=A0ABS4H533_9BACL|nr:nitronate monooxygenase family protein [Paenibacillus sediminis]MBP1937629.1 enoyl-[acyl-carrier protein] reductase II [Paenibacillus sediminis]